MKILTSSNDTHVLAYIREWVCRLSLGDFAEAQEWLEQPWPGGSSHLRETIYCYSPRYRRAKTHLEKKRNAPRIEDPRTMDSEGETFESWNYSLPDEKGGVVKGVEYFLPLDGKWSDMCVLFQVRQLDEETYGMRLVNVYVP